MLDVGCCCCRSALLASLGVCVVALKVIEQCIASPCSFSISCASNRSTREKKRRLIPIHDAMTNINCRWPRSFDGATSNHKSNPLYVRLICICVANVRPLYERSQHNFCCLRCCNKQKCSIALRMPLFCFGPPSRSLSLSDLIPDLISVRQQ